MNEFEQKIITMLGKVIDKQSEHDKRFESIDKKFDAIDERFNTIDKRFEAVDKRFDAMDKRFDTVENKLNAIAEQTANNTEFITTVKNDKS